MLKIIMNTKSQKALIDFYQENQINFILKKKQNKEEKLIELKNNINNISSLNIKYTAQNFVLGHGNINAKLMIIGEAPGESEDEQGQPFVGQSGKLLTKMLNSIDINRETDCYISNIVYWRPPLNRPPNTDEINICLPFVKKLISIIEPNILLLLGSVAMKALTNNNNGILKVRGNIIDVKINNKNITTLCSLHPAYLLRSPGYKMHAWKDFLTLKALYSQL